MNQKTLDVNPPSKVFAFFLATDGGKKMIKKEKKFLRPCHAVQKFVTLYDDGTFSPCEVLSSTKLGNIRDYDFDFYKMKNARDLNLLHKEQIINTKCNCEWMCAPPLTLFQI